jgi:tRNA(fMet)-specific endonuclease VapC
LKGLFDLNLQVDKIGVHNCFVSEITIAELKYGAENSSNPLNNRKIVRQFQETFAILPIYYSLDIYAKEKARLRKKAPQLTISICL